MKPAAANGMPKDAPKKYNIALDKRMWAAYYNIVIYHCYISLLYIAAIWKTAREAAMEEKLENQENLPDTMERIQQAALDEFLEKGFRGASLRQIVKHAGVTTGAFYGYFSSKEALFASIVEPHAAALMGRFMETQISFAERPEEEQPEHMGVDSGAYVHWMVDYICRHREPVKLLIRGAEGTSYENFVHNMVEVEVESTLRYMEVLRRLGRRVPALNKSLCHIIASGMFGGLFEVVIHDIPYD